MPTLGRTCRGFELYSQAFGSLVAPGALCFAGSGSSNVQRQRRLLHLIGLSESRDAATPDDRGSACDAAVLRLGPGALARSGALGSSAEIRSEAPPLGAASRSAADARAGDRPEI